jgi:hypothetical protein
LCGASFLQLSKKLVDFCRNAGTRAGVVRAQGLSLVTPSLVMAALVAAIHVF